MPGSLPPKRETRTKFPAPSFSPSQSQLPSASADGRSPCLSPIFAFYQKTERTRTVMPRKFQSPPRSEAGLPGLPGPALCFCEFGAFGIQTPETPEWVTPPEGWGPVSLWLLKLRFSKWGPGTLRGARGLFRVCDIRSRYTTTETPLPFILLFPRGHRGVCRGTCQGTSRQTRTTETWHAQSTAVPDSPIWMTTAGREIFVSRP